jgi:hypothetical protein
MCAVSQLTSLKYHSFGEDVLSQLTNLKYLFGEDVRRKPVDESKILSHFCEGVHRKPVDESKIVSLW